MKAIYVLIDTRTNEFWHPVGHNGKPKYVKRGAQAYLSEAKALNSATQFHPTNDPSTYKAVLYVPEVESIDVRTGSK